MQQTDFADSFIKGMLGWIRWIASSVANLFQGGAGRSGDMSMISWFADNWIKILIGLIVAGVLIDWLVWMARWRPYWVWFRKRRILLDNDVQGIDDDDLMLHYGDMAPPRARRGDGGALDEDFDDLGDLGDFDEFDEDGGAGYDDGPRARRYADEDDEDDDRPRAHRYADEGDEDDDYDDGPRARRYADEDDDYDDRPRARRYADEDEGDDDFDDLYDGQGGAGDGRGAEPSAPEAPGPRAAGRIRGLRAPRSLKRRGLFARSRRKAGAEEDPFSVEGDFFDDLGEDPMDDIVSPRAKMGIERDAQDTSIYQRPTLLPGDEPGAVRGADEEDGWHSGYTQRSAERGRRRSRKRDAGA